MKMSIYRNMKHRLFLTKVFQAKNTESFRAFVIVIVSLLIYVFTLEGDFVFDDSEAVVKNKDVIGSRPLCFAFKNDFWGSDISKNTSHKSYRPLTILSFRLNYYMNSSVLDAFQFKATNLILNTICCLLIWKSFKDLERRFIKGYRCSRKEDCIDIPFWASLHFATHPVHVESVSGIVGRADILAGIFFFSSFLLYDKAIRFSNAQQHFNEKKSVLLSIMCASIGMLCKETGLTVLGFCLVYEILVNRSIFNYKENYSELRRNLKLQKSLKRLLSVFLSIVILMYVRWWATGGAPTTFRKSDNPAAFSESLVTRVLTYNYIYLLNLVLLMWPQWLCFDWSMGCVPLVESLMDFRVVPIVLMYVYGLLALRFVLGRNNRFTVASLAQLVIPFLPASNIFFTVGLVLAERILYIPSAGFSLLVTIGYQKLRRKCNNKRLCKVFQTLYVLVLVSFALRSQHRSRAWRTEYELFTSGLRVCPLNAKVHYNVAKAADARSEVDLALYEYREAIRLYPEYYQAMNNLANMLKNRKHFFEAEDLLLKALAIEENFPAAWMNLGIVLANTNRNNESEQSYLKAIHYRRNYPDCYYNLGNLYLQMEEHEKAIKAWEQAISLNKEHAMAWTNLLALLDNTGQSKKAEQLIPVALSAAPDSPSVHFVAANINGKRDNFATAEKLFIKAIQLFDTQVQAIHYANFGVLYHRWKKYKKAAEYYKKAIKIDPHFRSAIENLRTVEKLIE